VSASAEAEDWLPWREIIMSHAIAKLLGEPKSRQTLEVYKQRVAAAAVTAAIAFLAVLVIAL
jgi:hypothetical protein